MKREFLGDSYDAVKRLWQQLLSDWAPLYFEPRFLPENIRDAFTRLTGIHALMNVPPSKYSILNDPDTGIRLPTGKKKNEGRSHIAVTSIAQQFRPTQPPRCVITFDHSNHRKAELPRKQQRYMKMAALRDHNLASFYYVSHAPFLFAFPNVETSEEFLRRLVCAGIPADRFEK